MVLVVATFMKLLSGLILLMLTALPSANKDLAKLKSEGARLTLTILLPLIALTTSICVATMGEPMPQQFMFYFIASTTFIGLIASVFYALLSGLLPGRQINDLNEVAIFKIRMVAGVTFVLSFSPELATYIIRFASNSQL
jgi:hypothetical protein